jgi:protein gp37
MGDKTIIEWTDATWNPVTGCTKVSAGCANCYAERLHHRSNPGSKFTTVIERTDRLFQPLKWRRPRKIFVNSMSDLFHENVSASYLDKCFAVMALASRHTFQVLTKRPERMRAYFNQSTEREGLHLPRSMFSEARVARVGESIAQMRHENIGANYIQPYSNVWLGVSVEDQQTFDERSALLRITPAAVRFISYEPALGPIDAGLPDDLEWLDWLIAGGESGPKARLSHPDWFRSARDQCHAAGVPFFFKQWGEWSPIPDKPFTSKNYAWVARDGSDTGSIHGTPAHLMTKRGRKRAGRLLDGKEWNEFPKSEVKIEKEKNHEIKNRKSKLEIGK